MKLIDKKGKLFGVINAIDAVIALIIIVIAAGAVYKFAFMDKTSTVTPMEPVTYTVEIKKLRSFTMDNVKEGDTLLNPIVKMVGADRFTKNVAKQTEVKIAKLGNDAGIIGAAFIHRLYRDSTR